MVWAVSSYWSKANTINRNEACFGKRKEMEGI
jgi:hypothetical protein